MHCNQLTVALENNAIYSTFPYDNRLSYSFLFLRTVNHIGGHQLNKKLFFNEIVIPRVTRYLLEVLTVGNFESSNF
jgi:hypothetical protein